MVNGEEMPNAAGQDTIAFLFSETEWWEKNPKQTKQQLQVDTPCLALVLPWQAVCHSQLPCGMKHEASMD